MAAKHARANAMAQTITLIELIINPISLSVFALCEVWGFWIYGTTHI
jgi:hypothetical protein